MIAIWPMLMVHWFCQILFWVAPPKPKRHVLEAFRLSPRDIDAYLWMRFVGVAKLQLGADAEAVALVTTKH